MAVRAPRGYGVTPKHLSTVSILLYTVPNHFLILLSSVGKENSPIKQIRECKISSIARIMTLGPDFPGRWIRPHGMKESS